MPLETVGLQSVFETAEFKKGLAEYIAGVTKATKETTKAQSETEKLTFDKATNRWRNASGQFASNAQMVAAGVKSAGSAASTAATGGLAAIASSALVVVAALTKVVTVAFDAAKAVLAFGKEALFTAGRVDELNRVALLLGQNTGRSQAEVQGFLDGLRDMGIRADVGAKLVAQLARRNLDLAQSTELAAVAQDAAVLSGQDSSDALDKLVLGITTYNTRILRTAGLNVNMQQAFENLANELGKDKDALTEAERVQAAFNATLEEGTRIAGVYSVAQDSPTKALRSLGREMFNLRAEVGGPFLDAWKSIIDIARAVVQAFTSMVSEGGGLRPLLINLGAAASIMADGIKNGAMVVIEAFQRLRIDASGNVGQFIEDAFTWGVEIVGALAEGMVEGASTALTAAMNAIQNLLGSWLAPGSPPKVAPHIDKWGAGAFTEYLRGFGQADFGVLKGLQSVLGKFMEKTELQDITLDIGTAVAEGPTAEFFDKIRTAAGEFGGEVVKLAQNYFELSDAQSASEMAQTQLNDAMKAMSEAEISVNNLTKEYNDLLRAGASDEILDAQLEQIKAAEEQLALAGEQKAQAEENVQTTEERLKALAEEAGLQEELVNQLLALAAEEKKAAEATGGAGAGTGVGTGTGAGAGAGVEGIGAGIGAGLGAGITTGIQTAIEDAKAKLLEKLGNIFAPLRKRWGKSIKLTLQDLKERFLEFKDRVSEAWEEIQRRVDVVIFFLTKWWEDKLPAALEKLKLAIQLKLLLPLRRVRNFITLNLIPKLKELAEDAFEKVKTAISDIKEFISGENGLIESLKEFRDFIKDKLSNALSTFRTTYIQPLVDAFDEFREVLESVHGWLSAIKSTIDWILNNEDDIEFGNDPTTSAFNRSASTTMPVIINVPAMATATAGDTTTNHFDFGGNNINDQMDLASLQALIIQTIRQELG